MRSYFRRRLKHGGNYRWLPYLNNAQTERLQEVLQYTLFDYEVTKIKKDEELSEQNLVESFLSAKRIEGCSEKTLKYYNATIQSMLDGIGKSIKYIVTDDIRCYLTEYQAKKKSSKVMYWMVSIPRIDTNDSIIYSKEYLEGSIE